MVRVRLKTNFNPKIFDHFEQALHANWFIFQDAVYDLGKNTAQVMRDRIEQTRKREKDGEGLAELIEFIPISTTGKIHFGIGDLQKIKEKAPYYLMINYGGMLHGKFVPPGVFSNFPKPDKIVPQTGRWKVGESTPEGRKFSFKPKKPIEGVHYIEAGIHYFKAEHRKLTKESKKVLRNLMRGKR